MNRILSIILICIMLSSCIYTQVKLSDTDLKNIRKVGLVSLLPEDINLHYVGVTVFNNTYNRADISGFDANKIAAEVGKNDLKKSGIEVVELKGQKGWIKSLYRNSYSSPNKDAIQSELEKLARSADVSHMVVIYSNPVQDRIAGSAEFNSGYGIFKRVVRPPAAYSSISVDIAEIVPFKYLISSGAFTMRSLPQSLWHSEYEDDNKEKVRIPNNQNKIISDSINETLRESVSNALKYAGLTN